ncbi:MAG: DUF1080 domain-containing protein [Actinobacteria bacterium]|nr:DUF1080 domain-containing protein [Actinomycetota bacterium]
MKKINNYFKSLPSFISKYKLLFTGIVSIIGFLVLLDQLKWLNPIANWVFTVSGQVWEFLKWNPWGLPNILWILLSIWLIWATYQLLKQNYDLSIVAGTFDENFKDGLVNWDYSGSWKILKEDGQFVLNVSGHESEGITKKGFTWSDYEFSFETKIVKRASGWIVRADGKNRFFMLQIFMDNIDTRKDIKGPMLRPHYREARDDFQTIWGPIDQDAISLNSTDLNDSIKLYKWIKVRIVVRGEDMVVHINGINVFKYNLYKTVSTDVSKNFIIQDAEGKVVRGQIPEKIILGSYRIGSIGFREASDEEALFRNIKVKPL